LGVNNAGMFIRVNYEWPNMWWRQSFWAWPAKQVLTIVTVQRREAVPSAIDADIEEQELARIPWLFWWEQNQKKAAFDKFKLMISCVHGCFTYFNKVMPQLAKEEAHREFHKPA